MVLRSKTARWGDPGWKRSLRTSRALRGLISVARRLDVPRILPQAGRQAPLAKVRPVRPPRLLVQMS